MLQHHSNYFINSAAAESRLALLCTSYLTFSCFDAQLDESDIRNSVQRGDYAFQEYATFNWIHHVSSVSDTSNLRDSIRYLHKRHLRQFPRLNSDSNFGESAIDEHDVSAALEDCRKAYDQVDNLYADGKGQGEAPIPFLPKDYKIMVLQNSYHISCTESSRSEVS